jgi:acyl-coenzyme A synthetase/AMP-(fatty) acid ligase/surface polysaccharide O-acyltransferase-like enzyme
MYTTLASRLALSDRNQTAGVDDTCSINYADLLEQATDLKEKIGPEREIVILECENSIKWLVSYVALHLGNHAMLLVPQGATEAIKTFTRTYSATVEISAATAYAPIRLETARPALHPELSVLLLTSGSTGSPKCVRLSHENIASNAQSIVTYLGLSTSERGVVNLPVHYSYGMSIVNSHLWAGATLLLTQRSVVESEFWEFSRKNKATSFAGVPHTYDLLSHINFPQVAPDTLRYFTQAGGRLAPERAIELANIARSRKWRFYIMYGQTEAAPRMAFLPPDAVTRHAGSIGIAIPNGTLKVQDENGQELPPNTEGELVYEGANVMMGYAFSYRDLKDGQGVRQLRTGDLAKSTEDGFFYITGRISRFVKIFGTRISLDEVERLCTDAGYPVIATGNDFKILVVTREEDHLTQIRELIQTTLTLPAIAIEVRFMTQYPVLSNGKMDYAGLKASIGLGENSIASGPRTVQEIYKAILGSSARDEALSFNDLNGDSLTFVRVSLELEESFGNLPDHWPEIPAAVLQGLLSKITTSEGNTKRSSSSILQNIDTLRAIACIMVVMAHVFGITQNSGLKISDVSPWRAPLELLDLIRMPLFTALAGVLYAAMPTSSRVFPKILINRFLSLLIPAVSVSILYFGIRKLAGKEDATLSIGILYGYLHLWYLYALFIIVIVIAAIDLVMPHSNRSWLIVIFGFYLMYQLLPWTPLTQALDLAPFYVLGLLAYRNPEALRNRSLIVTAVILSIAGLLTKWLNFFNYTEISPWLPPLFSAALIIFLMRFTPRSKNIEWIGVFSYAIYLWHPAANGAVREILQNLGLYGQQELFVLGTLAGIFIPILMYRVISRWPYPLSLALIGR